MNTPSVEFLPGDRVRYNNADFPRHGKLGTVVDPRSIGKAGAMLPAHLPVKMDGEAQADFFLRSNFEHQPITSGCWVRVTGRFPNEINTDRIGDVFKVAGITANAAYFTLPDGACSSWNLKHLVRIAEPAPATRFTEPNGEPKMTADEKLARAREGMPPWAIVEIVADTTGRRMIVRNERAEELTRIMTDQRAAIEEAANLINTARPHKPGWLDSADAWLTKYAPEKLPKPPVFKRGDLVGVDRGDTMVPAKGRIVSRDHDRPIVEVVTKFGDFIMTDVDHIKHVAE